MNADRIGDQGPIVIESGESPDLSENIRVLLKSISLTPPGCKLLEKAIGYQTKIRFSENPPNSNFEMEVIDGIPTIRFNHRYQSYYVSAGDQLVAHPLHITLAHELLHAIHFHFSAEDFRSKSNNNIPLFDNEEEKLTICGEGSDINVLELCENRFLEVAGLPCRINHCGVTKKTSIPIEQLGILDFLTAEAWGSFKNLIEKDSTKVNELAVNPENEKQSCLPLSLVRSLNGMELLLKEGARIDLLDDLGGPIVAAFEDSYGLAAWGVTK